MPRPPHVSWWQRLLRARLFLLVAAVVCAFLLIAFARETIHRYEVRQEIAKLEQQIGDLESRKESLSGLIDYFSSPLYQEQEAREKLGLAKAGERVVIVPLTNSTPPVTAQTPAAAPEPSNPQKWWRYFFARDTN